MRLEASVRNSDVLLAVDVSRVSRMQVLRWNNADELLIALWRIYLRQNMEVRPMWVSAGASGSGVSLFERPGREE